MNNRRWLQIHLSTAIVLMFAASGILWLNTKESAARWPPGVYYEPMPPGYHCKAFGWPYTYRILYGSDSDNERSQFNDYTLTIDIIVALFTILITAVVCEWLIYRRENNKSRN